MTGLTSSREVDGEDLRSRRASRAAGEEDRCDNGQRGEKCPQESRFHSRKDSISGLSPALRGGGTLAEDSKRCSTLRLAACPASSPSPATAWAGNGDDRLARPAARRGPDDRRRRRAGPFRPGRPPLAGHGHGARSGRGASPAAGAHGVRPRPRPTTFPIRGAPRRETRRGWRLGSPYWVGAVRPDRLPDRRARCSRLQAWYVWSPVEAATGAHHGSMAGIAADRAALGLARERRRSAAPRRSTRPTVSVRGRPPHRGLERLHAPRPRPAIVRAIELYHVKGNGWNDIGYNFLVDQYGNVFEGRAGGIDRNVIGAHAEGFNTGSVGVAVIGNYAGAHDHAGRRARARPAARLAPRRRPRRSARVRHLAVRAGTPKYPKGTPVLLRAISGHRDTGFTACPGATLYASCPRSRTRPRRSGCRSCTHRSSAAGSAARSRSRRVSRRPGRGR